MGKGNIPIGFGVDGAKHRMIRGTNTKSSRMCSTKKPFALALLVVVAATLLLAVLPQPALAATAITNCTELQNIRNDLTGNYYLANDINCSGFDYGDGKGFMPIENLSNPFNGTFDGKGYTITGLYINRSSTNNVGLFGCTDSGSEIKNVGLEEVNVSGKDGVGGLVGYNDGTITNSYYPGDDITCTGCDNTIGNTTKANLQNKTWLTTAPNDWDFDTIRGIVEDVTYPYLRYHFLRAAFAC
ncbi:hypothetical protein C5S30_02440 [ANME-1 cluster archaeon GoMg4]|nr:hypothetical protein [ANME-1 cluster archaeon GoMg4]